MKVVLIRGDSTVGVDGVFRTVDVTDLDHDIHAISFDTVLNEGSLKYNGSQGYKNVWLTDFSPYQTYVTRWSNIPAPAQAPDASDTNNLGKIDKALALCIAQVGGLSNAQIKTLFKNKWDSLP